MGQWGGGEKRGQKVMGSGIHKVAGSGRNRGNYATLRNILQSKNAKRWEPTKIGQEVGS